MFVLMTVVFLVITIRNMLFGPAFLETANEISLAHHLNKTKQIPLTDDIKAKTFTIILFTLFVLTINLVYLMAAYDVDLLRWPTLTAIALFVGTLIMIRPKNSTEYIPISKHSLVRIIRNVFWLVYYGYILSLLL